jgi:predicted transcriptional regulator
MLNLNELARMLAGVNVKEVAKAASVSQKTIYRIRQLPAQPGNDWRPNVSTVEAITEALRASKPPKRRKPPLDVAAEPEQKPAAEVQA